MGALSVLNLSINNELSSVGGWRQLNVRKF